MTEKIPYRSMLCKDLDWAHVKYPCWVQPKLNGINARLWHGRLWTRDNKLFPLCVTEHILELWKEWPRDVCVQGELYRHEWPLQRIMGACAQGRKEASENTYQIEFFVYDFCTLQTFHDRWQIYGNLPLKATEICSHQCHAREDIERLHSSYLNQGYEGTIIRVPPCYYQFGRRSWNLMRWKPVKFMTVDVDGFGYGNLNTKYEHVMGYLTCRTPDGKYVNVGGGFSDKLRDAWCSLLTLPKSISIEYETLSENGVPLKPRFISKIS